MTDLEEIILDCIHYTSTDLCKYEGIGWGKQKILRIKELLEELKELRATSCGYSKEDIELNRNAMYNKAIDDLRNELKNHYTEYNIDCVLGDTDFYSYTTACNYLEDYIDEIAERLKEGEIE